VRNYTSSGLRAIRLLAIAAASLSTAYAAPLVVPLSDGSPTSASALVDLLLGPAPNLSIVPGSPQYSGGVAASGTFTAGGTGSTGLGIDRGVVLTSGDARFLGSSAAFVGDSANKDVGFTAGVGNSLTPNSAPGDSLFDSLTPFGSSNASILSFSFVPEGSALVLRLVFGSEDYNDLVNSGFPTDVFGVFVNGVNYALVPGTSTPISASSINCGGPTSGPAPDPGADHCALYRDNPPFFDVIDSEIDGFTVPIDLSIPVNLGVVNTISIGIADNLDFFGDSALLLAEGSIRSGSGSSVSEPSMLALLLTAGIACLAGRRRRGSRERPASTIVPAHSQPTR